MSWELRVYTPLGGPHVSGSQIASYTPSSPGGIVGEMRWTVRPNGDCVQLEFQAVPKLVDIPPRAIVQLLWQNTPVFYGFITQSWPNTDGKARRYVALGARSLLRGRVYVLDATGPLYDVAVWFRVAALNSHPSIRLDFNLINPALPSTRIPNTNMQIQLGQVDSPLDKLFDLLAGSARASWGVDAEGFLFLRTVPTVSPISELPVKGLLPILSEDVFDAVRLITPEGYIHDYGTPQTYGIYKTFALPFSLRAIQRKIENPTFYFLSNTGGATTYNTTNRTTWSSGAPIWGYLTDGDPNTGVRLDLTNNQWGYHSYDLLVYPQQGRWITTELDVDLQNTSSSAGSRQLSVQGVAAGPTGGSITPPRDQTSYTYVGRFALTPGLEQGGINLFFHGRVNTTWMVWTLDFYGVPTEILDGLAESLLSKAMLQSEPKEVVWPQYVPPSQIITSPSGNLSASEWTYALSPERGLTTTCAIGAPKSDPQANAIRFAVRQGDEDVSLTLAMLAAKKGVL